jgi:two-component system KDP operon response regulator KdpE
LLRPAETPVLYSQGSIAATNKIEAMVTAKLFYVDSEVAAVRDIQPVLAREGYQVECCLPGRSALRRILIENPDLVILGIGQDDGDWRFCRQLVPFLEQPLLLLLASSEELDQVRGLDMGADDCMVKPVALLELVARIRALLRRNRTAPGLRRRDLFMDGDLVVDLTRKEVRLADRPVSLTPTEYRLLACFVQHTGQVLSRERLLAEVWGPGHADARNLIKQHVHHLRKKIEPDPQRPCHIVTERGLGYRFQVVGSPKPMFT